jgi:hypothetical protein
MSFAGRLETRRAFTACIVVVSVLVMAAVGLAVSPAVAAAPGPHRCRQGDPPLYASARASCQFAGNIIEAYVNVCHESRNCRMAVRSPVTGTRYRITCHRTGHRYTGTVSCRGPANSGIWTRFSSDI